MTDFETVPVGTRGMLARIKWRSIDKDNMEFEGTVTATCYQLDALREWLGQPGARVAGEAIHSDPDDAEPGPGNPVYLEDGFGRRQFEEKGPRLIDPQLVGMTFKPDPDCLTALGIKEGEQRRIKFVDPVSPGGDQTIYGTAELRDGVIHILSMDAEPE